MHVPGMTRKVAATLEDQIELIRVFHLAVESLTKWLTLHQVSVRADRHAHERIVGTQSAHVVHELHLVEVRRVSVARVGQDAEVVNEDEDVGLAVNSTAVQAYLLIDFARQVAQILMAHQVCLHETECRALDLGRHVSRESVGNRKRQRQVIERVVVKRGAKRI